MPLTPLKIPDNDLIRQTRVVVNSNADLLIVAGVPTDTGFSLETEGGDAVDVDLTGKFITRAEAAALASVGIATEDTSGQLKISSETQARQGTDDTTAMTPYKVALAFLARNLPFFNFDDAAPGKQVVVDSVDPDTGGVTLKVVNAIVATLNAVVQNGRAAFGAIFLDEGTTEQGGLPGLVLRVKATISTWTELLGIRAIDKDTASINFKGQPAQVFEDNQIQLLNNVAVTDWLTAKQAALKVMPIVDTAQYKVVADLDPRRGYVFKRQLNTNGSGSGTEYDLTTPIEVLNITFGSNESVQTSNWQLFALENIAPGQWRGRTVSQREIGQYALIGMDENELRNKLSGSDEVDGDARLIEGQVYCRPAPTPAQLTQAYNVNAAMFGTPQAHNLQTTGGNIMGILLNTSGQFEQNVTLTYPDSGHFLLTPVSAEMTDWTGKLRLDKTVTP
jgi:hypothetical protein